MYIAKRKHKEKKLIQLKSFFYKQALDILTPKVEDNAKQRLRAHIRRGTSFCEMQCFVEGLMDYEEALKIEPLNKEIEQDANKIRNIIIKK